jgi:hypothetical protein
VLGDEKHVQHLLLQSQAPPGGGFQDFTTNKGVCGACKFHENFTEISTLKISESETAHPCNHPDKITPQNLDLVVPLCGRKLFAAAQSPGSSTADRFLAAFVALHTNLPSADAEQAAQTLSREQFFETHVVQGILPLLHRGLLSFDSLHFIREVWGTRLRLV